MQTHKHEQGLRVQKQQRVIHELCAGGIVFRNTPKGARIGFIRNLYRRWTFPKGHVNPGETLEEAALRETREEMGLDELRLIEELGSVRIRFTERHRPGLRGAQIDKRIHFFLMEAPSDAPYCPQRSQHVDNITWVGTTKVRAMVGYHNLQPIAARAVDVITAMRRASMRS